MVLRAYNILSCTLVRSFACSIALLPLLAQPMLIFLIVAQHSHTNTFQRSQKNRPTVRMCESKRSKGITRSNSSSSSRRRRKEQLSSIAKSRNGKYAILLETYLYSTYQQTAIVFYKHMHILHTHRIHEKKIVFFLIFNFVLLCTHRCVGSLI